MVSLSVEITNNPQSIENLLTKYFSREQLSDYVCGKDESQGCKLKGFSYKLQEILEIPNYLLIHLKIYNDLQKKLDGLHFDINKKLFLNNQIYILHGIIYHIGEHINSGHYLAEVLIEDQWYETNDQSIKQISEPSRHDPFKTPYILLYHKMESIINDNQKDMQTHDINDYDLENYTDDFDFDDLIMPAKETTLKENKNSSIPPIKKKRKSLFKSSKERVRIFRSKISDEKKDKNRDMDKKYKKKIRSLQSEEEKDKARDLNKAAQAKIRSQQTEIEKDKARDLNKASKAKMRSKQTEEEKDKIRDIEKKTEEQN